MRRPSATVLLVGLLSVGCKKTPPSSQAVDAAAPPTPECLAADQGRGEARARLSEGKLHAALAALDAADAKCPATAAAGLADRARTLAELARKEETDAVVARIAREGDAAAKAAAAEASQRVAALAAASIGQLVAEALAPAEPALHAQRVERARDVLERDQKATPRLVVKGPNGPVKQVTWDKGGVLFAHGSYVSGYDEELAEERVRWVCGTSPVTSLVADEALVAAASATDVCLFDRRTLRAKGTLPLRAPVRLVPGKPWVAAATAADPKTVVVTSVDTLAEVARIKASQHLADTFDVSKDGKRLAIGAEVFDLTTHKALWSPDDPTGEGAAQTSFVRFSPDGRGLAIGRDSYSPALVSLYDTASTPADDAGGGGGQRWSAALKRAPRDLAFSPNGAFLAVSGSLTIRLYTTKDGALFNAEGSLHEHGDATTSAAWSPSGEGLVASGEDGSVRAWNLMKGKSVHTLLGPFGFVAPGVDALQPRPGCAAADAHVAALRKANHLIVGCAGDTIAYRAPISSTIHVVDKDDKELWTKQSATPVVDGKHRRLLHQGYDTVFVHALDTGKQVAEVKTGPLIAVSSDGRAVARRDEEGDLVPTLQGMLQRGPLRLVDLETKKILALDPEPGPEWEFVFSTSGDLVGVTVHGADATLVRVSGTTGKTLWTRTLPRVDAIDLATVGGEELVAVSERGVIALHAVSTGALVRTVGPVFGRATFSAGGGALVTRGFGHVTVHDASTGALRRALIRPSKATDWIALDGAGRAQAKPADRALLACAIGARVVPVGLCEELFVDSLPVLPDD